MRQMYSAEPWIFPRAPERITDLFDRFGSNRRFERGELVNLGDPEGPVFLVEEGLFATYAGGQGLFTKALALFPMGSLLGAVRTLTQQPCDLMARVLADARVRAVPAQSFRDLVCADVFSLRSLLPFLFAMPEAQTEGLVTNCTLPASQRLCVLFNSLIVSAGKSIESGWNRIPYDLTSTELGSITHLTRISVSRVLSDWTGKGLLRRNGRTLYAHETLFANTFDWIAASRAARARPTAGTTPGDTP